MKRKRNRTFFAFTVVLCAAVSCLISAGVFAAKDEKEKPAATVKEAPKQNADRVVAYYFHGKFRCTKCKLIESYSDEAIKSGFAGEIKSGALEWKVVNVEEKGNEHFINDYKLYTKSLVLVRMKDGKQAEWKNLEKVWDLLGDKEAFEKYVKEETTNYLKAAKEDGKKKDKKKAAK